MNTAIFSNNSSLSNEAKTHEASEYIKLFAISIHDFATMYDHDKELVQRAERNIKLIVENLELAYNGDLEAKKRLDEIDTNISDVTYEMERSITAQISNKIQAEVDISDDILSTIIFPAVLNYKRHEHLERLAQIAKIIGIDTTNMSLDASSRAVVIYAKALIHRLGFPVSLERSGLTVKHLEELAAVRVTVELNDNQVEEVAIIDFLAV